MSVLHVSDSLFNDRYLLDGALSGRLFRVSRAMAAADSVDALLHAFVSPACQGRPCDAVLLWATGEVNGDYLRLRPLAAVLTDDHGSRPVHTYRVRDVAIDRDFLETPPGVIVAPDLADEAGVLDPALWDVARESGASALTIVPLPPPGGPPAGAVVFLWDEPYSPPPGMQRLYALLAPEFAALVNDWVGGMEKLPVDAIGPPTIVTEDESEARFRQVFDESPLGMALTDTDGRIQRVNRTLCKMLGHTEDGLTELSLEDITHPNDRDLDAHWAYAVREGKLASYQTEKRYLTRDGETIWVEVTSTLVRQDDGRDYGLRMVQDITERKWVQAAEREQRVLADALRKNIGTISSTLELDDVLDRILESMDQVVPHGAAEVMLVEGTEAYFARARGYAERGLAEWARCVRLSVSKSPTLTHMSVAKEPVCVVDTYSYDGWVTLPETAWIRSHIGAPIIVGDAVIGFLHANNSEPAAYSPGDAERLQAFADQAAIAIKNARLFNESQRRNERLEVLNEITHIGATTLDLDRLLDAIARAAPRIVNADRCYVSLWNPATDQPAGVASAIEAVQGGSPPEESMPGTQSLSNIALSRGDTVVIPEVAQATVLSRRLRMLVRERLSANALLILPLLAGDRWVGALTLACDEPREFSDEDVAWAEQVAEATALAAARAQAYAGLEERVAQRTAELMAANQRLMQLGRMKDEFVSNVSHELRTPIASLKLYHHLLTARPDKREAYLERLDRETERLEMIIENLLYLSRMDQEQLQLEWTRLNLGRLVEVLIMDREPLAARQGLTLEHYVESGLPPVRADEMAVGQAVSVLLTNALTYTPEGGTVRVGAWLDEQNDGRWVAIGVSDTGPGIPEEERERLFERFFRGKAGHDSGVAGTGLGLAIAREIVERHEGCIDLVDTNAGGGATFVIRLPPID